MIARRAWLTGGVAAAAATGGAVWSWWRTRPTPVGDPGLWMMSFPTPDGGRLAMDSLRGRPLVLNFWATWCPPCVREMPALDRFHRRRSGQGWQVVGLAVDSAAAVREFLARAPVGYPIALAGFEGSALSRRLGNPQGALPFTVVFAADGSLRQTRLGETSEAELERWAES